MIAEKCSKSNSISKQQRKVALEIKG